MTHHPHLLFAIMLFLLCAPAMPARAQAPNADWKLYGSTPKEKCFYDAAGAQQRPDNLTRVWVKCLAQSEMDDIDIKQDYGGKILDRAADKTRKMYIPPLATISDVSFEDATLVIAAEQIADISFLEPTARIFYELDCQERRLRELSISLRNVRAGDKAKSWSYAAPETNGDRLLKLLCR